MAYADIGDIASGAVISEAYLDGIRANFQAGVPDIFTAEGDLAIGTGADAAALLAIGAADSTLVAGAARPEWQIIPAVHVTKSDTTAMATSAWTAITFDTETSDTNAMHSTVTNTQLLTVPTAGDGWYTFGFLGMATAVGGAGVWYARILVNGTTIVAKGKGEETGILPAAITLSGAYPLAATDNLVVQYYVISGTVTLSASPMFWAIWQRRA